MFVAKGIWSSCSKVTQNKFVYFYMYAHMNIQYIFKFICVGVGGVEVVVCMLNS